MFGRACNDEELACYSESRDGVGDGKLKGSEIIKVVGAVGV